MSLSDDLLDTARKLVAPPGTTEADIRRAVSTAYYALFHRLVEAAAAALVPTAEQQQALARRFSHTEMRKVCQLVLKSQVPPFAVPFFGTSVPADLADLARAFAELQERRHKADYDSTPGFYPRRRHPRDSDGPERVRCVHSAHGTGRSAVPGPSLGW